MKRRDFLGGILYNIFQSKLIHTLKEVQKSKREFHIVEQPVGRDGSMLKPVSATDEYLYRIVIAIREDYVLRQTPLAVDPELSELCQWRFDSVDDIWVDYRREDGTIVAQRRFI